MKKLSILVVFLLFISASIFAQDWTRLQATAVVDVAVAENGYMAVVNRTGELWTSRDAGANWAKDAQATGVARVSLNSNASVIGIVNTSGEFWISRNMGTTWTKTQATGVVDASVGRSNTFIVNQTGEVWFSPDLNNWTRTNAQNMKVVIFGGPFIFLADKDGQSFIADFNGNSNMSYRRAQGTGVADMDVAPNGRMWLVNTSGELWGASNSGATWNKDPQATGVAVVSTSNRYTIIANTSGEVWLKRN